MSVQCRAWQALLTTIVITYGNCFAAEPSAQERALDLILSAADRICGTVPLKGSSSNVEVTGKAKAELNELLKRVANLGIEGAAKYQSAEYQGVLQQDLLPGLKNSSTCKLEVFTALKDRLLPPSAGPAR